ncbi:MAG: serine/threonine protein kinase [Planctomycetes bacterium]|nr:serine/threonine protein kinase [Planctomycetota bacterium]
MSRRRREEVVSEACGDDDALRREVAALLEHADDAHQAGFLEKSRWTEVPVELLHTPELRPGDRIDNFEVRRKLGEGSFGVVYEATQFPAGRTVALKVMRRERCGPLQRYFLNEIRYLARFHHRGIAQIYEAGKASTEHGELPYFAMELVDGPSLLEYACRNAMSTRDRVRLLIEVCEAVQYAHDHGVLHRDLKPDNILVTGDGIPKILDFGIARPLAEDMSRSMIDFESGRPMGTLAYMSPEQTLGNPEIVDVRSDVYALGAVGYELLSGAHPIEWGAADLDRARIAIREQDPVPLSRRDPELRGDWTAIFDKALRKVPAQRYASPRDFAADLRDVLEHRPIAARPISMLERASKWIRRHRLAVASLSTIFVTLGTATTVSSCFYFEARSNLRNAQVQRTAWELGTECELIALEDLASSDSSPSMAAFLAEKRRVLHGKLPLLEARDDLYGVLVASLGRQYLRVDRLDEALEELRFGYDLLTETLGEAHPQTLRTRSDLGEALARAGNRTEGIRELEATLTVRKQNRIEDPLGDRWSWLALSRAHEADNAIRESAAALERGIELGQFVWGDGFRRTPDLQIHLSAALRRLDQTDRAERAALTALHLAVTCSGRGSVATRRARLELARVHLQQGRRADAIRETESATHDSPLDPSLRREIAELRNELSLRTMR